MKSNHTTLLKTNKLVVKKNGFLKNQLGVFTKKTFKKNQELFFVKGPIKSKPSIYSFSLNLDEHIEPKKINGNFDFGHYINHSCNPNAIVKVINRHNKTPYIKVIARKNIKKDEELTLDYASFEYVTVTNSICKCNAKNCRGIIYGFRDLPENIARKYKKDDMISKYLLNIKIN